MRELQDHNTILFFQRDIDLLCSGNFDFSQKIHCIKNMDTYLWKISINWNLMVESDFEIARQQRSDVWFYIWYYAWPNNELTLFRYRLNQLEQLHTFSLSELSNIGHYAAGNKCGKVARKLNYLQWSFDYSISDYQRVRFIWRSSVQASNDRELH